MPWKQVIEAVAADEPALTEVAWNWITQPATDDAAVCALAEALRTNSHVWRLDLSCNVEVGDAAADALISLLKAAYSHPQQETARESASGSGEIAPPSLTATNQPQKPVEGQAEAASLPSSVIQEPALLQGAGSRVSAAAAAQQQQTAPALAPSLPQLLPVQQQALAVGQQLRRQSALERIELEGTSVSAAKQQKLFRLCLPRVLERLREVCSAGDTPGADNMAEGGAAAAVAQRVRTLNWEAKCLDDSDVATLAKTLRAR